MAEGAIPIEHQIVVRSLMGGTFAGPAASRFAAVTREVFFPAGKEIYRAGDPAQHIYFVLDGRVELTLAGGPGWFFASRAVFGIIDAELDRPHTRSAHAVVDTRLLVLRAEDWIDLIEDNFELTLLRIERNARTLLERAQELPDWGLGGRELAASAAAAPEGELHLLERLQALQASEPFERAGMQPLLRLARGATERRLAAGDTLVREGDIATHCFVVAGGTVSVERAEPALAALFGPNDVVGSYAGFGQKRWAAAVRAVTEAVVLSIRYEDLYDVMEDHFDLIRSAMAFLAAERERIQLAAPPRE